MTSSRRWPVVPADPAVEAMLSDPALLAPLLALADATNRAAGGAATAAAGSPDSFFTPNSLGAVAAVRPTFYPDLSCQE